MEQAGGTTIGASVLLALLIGARTEELRALTWSHVDLDGRPDADPPVLPYVRLWRSVRTGGDTKTRTSRRTLALPRRCVDVLREHRARQVGVRAVDGDGLDRSGSVFTTSSGGPLATANVRRDFRRVAAAAGHDAAEWTPRELRHSIVSLLSDEGVPVEQIARLVGHAGGSAVYRKQLRPVIDEGVVAMDRVFGARRVSHSVSHSPGPGQGKRPGPELR